ncbi:MAG: hypothetical protein WCB14_01835, partial [Candidatus Acidiferrales bacterium]
MSEPNSWRGSVALAPRRHLTTVIQLQVTLMRGPYEPAHACCFTLRAADDRGSCGECARKMPAGTP